MTRGSVIALIILVALFVLIALDPGDMFCGGGACG